MSNRSLKELVDELRRLIVTDPKCKKFKTDISRVEREYNLMSANDDRGLAGILADTEKRENWENLKCEKDRLISEYEKYVDSMGLGLREYSDTLYKKVLYEDDKVKDDIDSVIECFEKMDKGVINESDAVNRGTTFMQRKYNLPDNFFNKL